MVTKFASYLVHNGVPPSKITILTFYNGQRKIIHRLLKSESQAGPCSVHTVDSYQGEENDVVLLSVVRSPARDRSFAIGFLDNQNRAVVAMSRARCGFYVFGNVKNLLNYGASGELWGKIFTGFSSQSRTAHLSIPVVCQRHQTQTVVTKPEDLARNAGGCGRECKGKLSCGHFCKLRCHV